MTGEAQNCKNENSEPTAPPNNTTSSLLPEPPINVLKVSIWYKVLENNEVCGAQSRYRTPGN
jgi:hypothetical protein